LFSYSGDELLHLSVSAARQFNRFDKYPFRAAHAFAQERQNGAHAATLGRLSAARDALR